MVDKGLLTFELAELRADFCVEEIQNGRADLRLLGDRDDLVCELLAEVAFLVAPRCRDAHRTHTHQHARSRREESLAALAHDARSSWRL